MTTSFTRCPVKLVDVLASALPGLQMAVVGLAGFFVSHAGDAFASLHLFVHRLLKSKDASVTGACLGSCVLYTLKWGRNTEVTTKKGIRPLWKLTHSF